MKRKLYSLINILGLATGMAVCLVLVLYIQNEFGYDNFHESGNDIYRVALERKYPSRTAHLGIIPRSIGQAIKKEFPEVMESVRMLHFGSNVTITVGERNFEEKTVYAVDSNFFKVFSGDFLQGDKKTALEKPNTAVINESTAKKFFGSAENAIGKSFKIFGSQNVLITGVCRDWPEKSHLPFGTLMSMSGFSDMNEPNYYDFACYTYLLLNKNASPEKLEAKFPSIIEKYVAGTIEKGFGETFEEFTREGNGYRYFLQPIKRIHLESNLEDELSPGGTLNSIYLFGMIAVFILFLACINFINLSTALSIERAKEVGIRKTFGSDKNALVWQFLSESIFFNLFSMLIASVITILLLPVFNKIVGTALHFDYSINPIRIFFLLGFAIVIGIVAGLYPAFVLSSFRPIIVLKGRFKSSKNGMALRNILVIFQFSISVTLMICTIVVNRQMKFMLGDKLGFKKDHIITIDDAGSLSGTQMDALVNELSRISNIEEVSRCTLPGGHGYATCAMQVVDTRVSRTQKTIMTDEKYLNLLGLQLKEGRYFSKDFASDSLSLVLNERAVQDFGLKNPIGSKITSTELYFNPRDGKSKYVYTVIGVVKDFHFQSLHEKIVPLVIANTQRFGAGTTAFKIRGDHIQSTIASIETAWKQYAPKRSFHYSFLDDNLAALYNAEQKTQKIFTVFSVLAIFIACIGLLGLATYATLQRSREISIRKVLGASVNNIIVILSKDFLRLVIIATLIAFPFSFWSMHVWLENYAYRVDISWWIFLVAGSLAAMIAIITISFQAIKAAVANPSKTLRAE